MSETVSLEAVVPSEFAGRRLDQALAGMFPDYSRGQHKHWIEDGRVCVDGRKDLRPRDRLAGGEQVSVEAVLEAQTEAAAEPISLEVLFEDEDIIVLDKPVGLVVHPGAGNPGRTLLNGLLHRYPECERQPRAGIVHRLDKDTSGVMVVARSPIAHTVLVEALSSRTVRREYEAVCVGVMTGGGTVDQPIGRHPVDRVRMAVHPKGKEAVTHYRVTERYRGHTLIRVRLETGRTHQIRVHLSHARYPLVGDQVYGGRLTIPAGASEELTAALRGFRRQALHAARLEFEHPRSKEPLVFEAPRPADLEGLIEVLRGDSETAT